MTSREFRHGMLGVWDYEGRSIPDGANIRTGQEVVTERGDWLIIESDDDARFQIAFDDAAGRISGDFVHWGDPTLWVYEGMLQDGVMTLSSRGPRMDGSQGETDYQDVWEILSPSERRLTGRLLEADGSWRDFTMTTYRRRT